MKIEDVLLIAGIANRARSEVVSRIKSEPGIFPNGGDDLFYAAEIGYCDILIAASKGLLLADLMELSFDESGRAVATKPAGVRSESESITVQKEKS